MAMPRPSADSPDRRVARVSAPAPALVGDAPGSPPPPASTPVRPGGPSSSTLVRELVDLHRLTENILRNMGSGLIAINAEGIVTHFNEQAALITGCPPDQAIGRPCEEVFRTPGFASGAFREAEPAAGEGGPGADAPPPPPANLLRRALTTSFGDGEVDLLTADGRVVPVQLRLTPLEEEDGPTVGAIGIFVDLTETKRAEEQARRKERLASLGELSAGVAHEIRNPLAGIGAAAQVLKKRLGEDADRTRFTDVILEEVGRLDKIVENLLRFARPAQPHLAEASLVDCINRVLGLVGEMALERGVRVDTSIDPGIPNLFLDADQIVQVLLNVVQNGFQAMSDGGVLTITLRRTQQPPYIRRRAGRRASDPVEPPEPARPIEYAEVAVTDTGDGIPADTLGRIFDPFFTTRRAGTGLGLSISQSIVREHGGMISISSTVGVGTSVLIHLPLEKRHGQRRRN